MKKGQLYTGKVEDITFPNKGVVIVDNEGDLEKAIVKDTLPGQEVSFVVSKKRKGKCEGRLKEILSRSNIEDREPPCKHFGECGGCTYQTMSYANQLELKKNVVKNILDEVITEPYEFQGIIGSPDEWNYRNKMEFSFGDEYKEGPLALGMHKKGSFYDIVTTDSCKIVHKDYNVILDAVLEFAKENNLTFHHKMSHTGFLRHLLIRRAVKTGEITVNIVTSSENAVDMKLLADKILGLEKNGAFEGKIIGITHIINDSLADVVKSDETRILYGQDYFYEELLGMKFKISTFSFFQTNSLGAERLYDKAREFVGETKDKVIFDLYSGTGTIAQMLAPVAKKVVGVEIIEEAVEAAKVNASLNGLDNCEFIAGDVLKVIGDIEEKPDLIVLDPPRDGIHPKALEHIINFGVDRLVYISCKPTSLARDLVILQERGYKVEKVCAVDMFPQTVHVETCVLLSNERNQHYNISVKVDVGEEYQKPKKITYKDIQDYIKEKYDFFAHSTYIAEVKRECGLDVHEPYNAVENPVREYHCTEERKEQIKEALRHFGMI